MEKVCSRVLIIGEPMSGIGLASQLRTERENNVRTLQEDPFRLCF